LRVPNHFKNLALHVTQYHTHCHKVQELRAATLVDLLQTLGAFKPDNHLHDFVLACEADACGRLGFEQADYPQAEIFLRAAQVAANTDTSAALNQGLQGAKIGEEIRRIRINAINSAS